MAAESDRLARRSNHRHRKTRRSSTSQATYPTFRLDPSTVTTTGTSAGYAKYIGRVGALAVALGVGAAVATGQGIGVARADDPPSTETSPTTNTQGEVGDSTLPPSKPPTTEPPSSPISGQSHSEPPHSPSPPEMNFSGSGSTLTFSEDKDTDEEEPSKQAPESPNPPETVAPPTPTDVPTTPQSPAPQANSSPTPPTPTNTPPAEGNSAHTNAGGTSIEGNSISAANAVTAPGSGARAQSRLMRTLDVQEIDPADGQQQLLTANTTQHASALSMTTQASTLAAPVDPVGALLAVPTTIINIAAGVVAAFLSPFLAPGPATPAEPPLLWAVLAWVRREVQRTFFNRSPVAIDNAYTTSEDSGLSGNVLTDGVDDTDADGDPLTATVVTGPQHGTLVLNPNGSFTYTPTANYSGTDTFTYKVSDETGRFHMHGLLGFLTNSGHSDTATVSITVTAANEPPIANADIATTAEDTPVSIDVLTNDSDPENNTLTPVVVTPSAKGTLVATANGWTYTPNANVNGTDSFSYKVNDGIADSNTATVSITVTPVEDPPTAPDLTLNVDTGVAIPINLLTIASDPDGDTVSIKQLVIRTELDTITINAIGTGPVTILTPRVTIHVPSIANLEIFTYTVNIPGVTTIDYLVTDGKADRTGTVTVNATFVNDDPVANPDTYEATEDTTLVAQPFPQSVLFNDFDADDQGLNVANPGTITTTEGGTVVITTDGTFTYNPKPNFSGVDTFTYTVTDGFGGTAVGQVTINVAAVPDNPSAVDDEYDIDEGQTLAVGNAAAGVLGNDSDGDGDALSVQNPGTRTTAFGGAVQLNANGTFTYTPATGFSGEDTFTYTVTDTTNRIDTATVTINVAFVNQDPVANPDTYEATEDTTLVAQPFPQSVLFNDFDADDQGLNVANPGTITTTEGGTVVITTDGTFTYNPKPNFSGVDTFTYTVTDGFGGTAVGQVTINVAAVPDNPSAVDDEYDIDEGQTLAVGNAAAGVLGNDSDGDGDALSVQNPGTRTTAFGGAVQLNANGTFTYTPATGFSGEDTFTYTVTDTTNRIDTATVAINVAFVNQDPVANPDTFDATEDTTLVSDPYPNNLLGNDFDADDQGLNVQNPGTITTTEGGTVVITTDGTFTYNPKPNFSGIDTFTYTVTDGFGGTATGQVTINVAAVPDNPSAVDDDYGIDEGQTLAVGDAAAGVLGNDSDGDGDAQSVQNPGTKTTRWGGTVALNADGTFTYTPPSAEFSGPDSFTYTVIDTTGATATATATINVAFVNDDPVANPDTFDATEDTTLVSDPYPNNLLGNDFDADDQGLSVESGTYTTTAGGTVVITSDGNFTYNPKPNFSGIDTFTYTVTDGFGGTATGHVTINVAAANQAPVAVNDTITTTEDNFTTAGNVLTNDTDAEGNPLTIVNPGVITTAHGAVVLQSDGTFNYAPIPNFNGQDSFTYRVSDGTATSNLATVTINVTTVNDAPVALPNAYVAAGSFTSSNRSVSGNVIADTPADFDFDGDSLRAVLVDPPDKHNNGTFVLNDNGSFSYRANRFAGTDTFSYYVTDGITNSNTITVLITINPA